MPVENFWIAFAIFSKYIIDHDKRAAFTLRLLCRPALEIVTNQSAVGPYHDQIEFLLASAGIYKTKERFDSAWFVYDRTYYSSSDQPALLYKLIDSQYLVDKGMVGQFANNEDIDLQGRRYAPRSDCDGKLIHCWDVNAAWVLAQVHKKRDFVLMSSLYGRNIYRSSRPNATDYSALTKELAAIYIMAEYKVSKIEFNHHEPLIRFSPTQTDDHYSRLSVHNFKVDKEDCARVVNYFLYDLEIKSIELIGDVVEELDAYLKLKPDGTFGGRYAMVDRRDLVTEIKTKICGIINNHVKNHEEFDQKEPLSFQLVKLFEEGLQKNAALDNKHHIITFFGKHLDDTLNTGKQVANKHFEKTKDYRAMRPF